MDRTRECSDQATTDHYSCDAGKFALHRSRKRESFVPADGEEGVDLPAQRRLFPAGNLGTFLILCVAFAAVLPILCHGPSCGHDFDYHLLSWLEAATEFAHLHYAHWAYTPAWNAGEPRFLFYPPLSWALGAALGLILPWSLVPAAFTFAALTLCGLTMRHLASRYAGPDAATLAAILYLVNPYMLFTGYERTAYGELLAAAWIPLLLCAALAPRVRAVPVAIPVALLWLTNAPAAVMSCYALFFVTLVRVLQQRSRIRLATTTSAGTLLGLALSCFYLLPAVYERRYIQSEMVLVAGMRIMDNTLFHHMLPPNEDNIAHDVVLHTASIVAILLLAGIAIASLLKLLMPRVPPLRRGFIAPKVGIGEADASTAVPTASAFRANHFPTLLPLLLLTLLIAFLLTPASLPIWAHVPELRFLQFPWRLTAILGSIFAVFAASAFDRLELTTARTCSGAAILAAALISPAWHLFHQNCDGTDTVQARVALYHSDLGTDPTDEYTPTVADNDSLKRGDPSYWLLPADASINTPAPTNAQPGVAPAHLTLTLPQPELLVLNRRQFPEWQLTLNGHPVAPNPDVRDDGLISVFLPAGRDIVDLTWHHTPDQITGWILSLLAAGTLGYARRKRPAPTVREDPAGSVLA
jgi:hypothetical protein